MLEPIYIVGPTGSGKSAIAFEFAKRIGGEIVNADAFQVYAGMSILTAQPSLAALASVPHHLYGFLDPSEDFDAARYETRARECIAEIQSRNVRPVIVGGSGLYVKALTHGLSDLPPVDANLRAELAETPLEQLLPRLLELDPLAASHVNLLNPRHVQRALEICLLTGQPASSFKQTWKDQAIQPSGVFLNPEREELYTNINRRTHTMFADGLVAEIQRLGPLSATAAKAIGLREILSLHDQAEAISSIQQATRRYAKRQVTWFKRETYFYPCSTRAVAVSQLLALA